MRLAMASNECLISWPVLASSLEPGVDLCKQLPEWQQVVDQYGERPVILGMATCEGYRASLSAATMAPR